MRPSVRLFAGVLLSLSLAGCGGGASTPAPTSNPSTVPVAFSIAIPERVPGAGARHAQYVSVNTHSAKVTVNPGNAVTIVNCTTACVGVIGADPGPDVFTISLYSGPNATGSILSTGTASLTVVVPGSNTLNVTTNPVVNAISFTETPASLPTGTSSTLSIFPVATDASGATILNPGNYVDANGNPLTFTIGRTDTTPTGGAGATSLTGAAITNPSTSTTVHYNGGTLLTTAFTATLTGGTIGGSVVPPSTTTYTYTVDMFPAGSGPRGLVAGTDGGLWFLGSNGTSVTRMSTSGVISGGYGIPGGAQGFNIIVGGDGNLWYASTFLAATIGTAPYAGPAATISSSYPSAQLRGIAFGPDGNYWSGDDNGTNNVWRTTPGGTVTAFPVGMNTGAVATGSDGNMWFLAGSANAVLKVSTAGALLNTYTVPTAASFPYAIVAGPDSALWFAEDSSSKIARITTAGVFTEFTLTGSSPQAIGVGTDGNIWFATNSGYGRITIPGGVVTEYPFSMSPGGLTAGPDGNIWVNDVGGQLIKIII